MPDPVVAEVETLVEEEPAEINPDIRGRAKLGTLNESLPTLNVPDDETLFQKYYYSIGEVAAMFNVNHSLLRYWETEFNVFKLKKNGKGDRYYRPEDVKNLKLIYHLLKERRYTIEGAREFMKNNKHAEKKFELINSLKSLQTFLLELKANL